jgi:hypothetical protein
LLRGHEEESSQKITELEVLCKRLRKEAQKLEEEKASLEGMVKSHDELITKFAKEIGLDRMGEDAEDEDRDEDGNDGGDATAPPIAVVPPPTPVPPIATAPKEVVEEEGLVESLWHMR